MALAACIVQRGLAILVGLVRLRAAIEKQPGELEVVLTACMM